jgi:hypothetical protein
MMVNMMTVNKRLHHGSWMRLLPHSLIGWTIFGLGVVALTMGVLGLASPRTQIGMMGFALVETRQPGDYTPAVLAIMSLATINTAILYLVGAVRAWPGFPRWVVAARLVMATGLVVLGITGAGPMAFIGAAIWEGLGALAIAVADARDRTGRAVGDRRAT